MNKKTKIALGAVATIAVVVIASRMMGGQKEIGVSYEVARVERGNLSTSVTATGTVEPITQVEVGTQVSGIVDKLYVDYNSEVKKGQVIAVLDKTNLENELSTAQCNLSTARTEYEYEEKNFNRIKQLYEKQLVSESEYETANYTFCKARNSYEVAKNNVRKAETNLGYATIYSPIDGVVLSRSVEEGQTVASSFSTPTLFLIANDLTRMRVIADVDEADIGGIEVGQRVTFTVDAYQGTVFNGEVMQVRQEATTTSNVVTYEVVINAPNPDLKLKPGLTASVTIFTMEKNNVLVLPGKALNFSPNAKTMVEGDEVKDVDAQHKVWTRNGKTFEAHAVEVGMSTGSQTELIGGLNEGDEVIVAAQTGAQMSPEMPQGERSPFMPGPPVSNKKK